MIPKILDLQLLCAFLLSQFFSGESIRCEVAKIKCSYRMGCGMALHSYMMDCADLIQGRTNKCHVSCQRALIALMSTEEGENLMRCDCEGSKFCELNKDKIEVCRPAVLQATAEGSVVSCSTARWICLADTLCSTALDYYHRFCRGLFQARRCTPRCNNSLAILNKQEKATKLKTCYCEGTEDFPCQKIKESTQRLCFGQESELSNEIDNHLDVLNFKANACDKFCACFILLSLALLTAICLQKSNFNFS